MPTTPPFVPDAVEDALADYLHLPHDQVVAGSFESLDSGVIRWQQADGEGRIVERTVKVEPAQLRAIIDRARERRS